MKIRQSTAIRDVQGTFWGGQVTGRILADGSGDLVSQDLRLQKQKI